MSLWVWVWAQKTRMRRNVWRIQNTRKNFTHVAMRLIFNSVIQQRADATDRYTCSWSDRIGYV